MCLPLSAKNELDGKIPSQLSELRIAETLHLNDNKLDGTVPIELKNMNQLKTLYLTGNLIFGDVDEVFCKRPDSFETLSSLELDCLQEDLTCTCCSKCCDGSGYCCDNDDVGTCGEE